MHTRIVGTGCLRRSLLLSHADWERIGSRLRHKLYLWLRRWRLVHVRRIPRKACSWSCVCCGMHRHLWLGLMLRLRLMLGRSLHLWRLLLHMGRSRRASCRLWSGHRWLRNRSSSFVGIKAIVKVMLHSLKLLKAFLNSRLIALRTHTEFLLMVRKLGRGLEVHATITAVLRHLCFCNSNNNITRITGVPILN